MKSIVTMKALLESGVHFGHRTNKWHPLMKPYIFTERNSIHIIDLQQTVKALNFVYEFVREKVSDGGIILFVGTKRQAQETIRDEAGRCNMPYVNERWLGGTLTNWFTIQKRIKELERLERLRDSGEINRLTKKEGLLIEREINRLDIRLSGLRTMTGLPDLLFAVDVNREATAIHEANLKGIPVIALVDTNCDPRVIDYIIPSNDDAIRAIKLLVSKLADAVLEGQALRKEEEVEEGIPTMAGEIQVGGEAHPSLIEEVELKDEELLGEATLAKLSAVKSGEMDKITTAEVEEETILATAAVEPEELFEKIETIDTLEPEESVSLEEAVKLGALEKLEAQKAIEIETIAEVETPTAIDEQKVVEPETVIEVEIPEAVETKSIEEPEEQKPIKKATRKRRVKAPESKEVAEETQKEPVKAKAIEEIKEPEPIKKPTKRTRKAKVEAVEKVEPEELVTEKVAEKKPVRRTRKTVKTAKSEEVETVSAVEETKEKKPVRKTRRRTKTAKAEAVEKDSAKEPVTAETPAEAPKEDEKAEEKKPVRKTRRRTKTAKAEAVEKDSAKEPVTAETPAEAPKEDEKAEETKPVKKTTRRTRKTKTEEKE